MKNLHIYIDETGNTGDNIFDLAQPYFINGVLISDGDFNKKYGRFIKKFAEKIGVIELHGNELGLGRIEIIAEDMARILEEEDIDIFFAIIDKVFLVKLKFFDIFFDSGLNKMMMSHRYSIRALRMLLSYRVAELIDYDMAKKFWISYKNNNRSHIIEVIQEVIEKSVRLDTASQEIVCDCLNWAMDNMEVFENALPKEYDVPNTTAMSLLITYLNYRYKDEKVVIKKFVHDNQKQFGGYLEDVFKYIHLALPNYEPFSFSTELLSEDIYMCNFEMDDSSQNQALQFIDALLWLTKKALIDKKKMDNSNKELCDIIYNKAGIAYIEKIRYESDLTKLLKEIMSTPITDDDLKKAEEVLYLLETAHNETMITQVVK